eukprot:gene10312-7209_t
MAHDHHSPATSSGLEAAGSLRSSVRSTVSLFLPAAIQECGIWGVATAAPPNTATVLRLLQWTFSGAVCYYRSQNGAGVEVPDRGQGVGSNRWPAIVRPYVSWQPGEMELCRRFLVPTLTSIVGLLLQRLRSSVGKPAAGAGLQIPAADGGGTRRSIQFAALGLVAVAFHYILSGIVLAVTYPATILSITQHPHIRDRVLAFDWERMMERRMIPERNPIPAPTGTGMLDSVMVSPPGGVADRTMLYIGGNAEFMEEELSAAMTFVGKLQCNVVVYNPRGVGYSSSAGRVSHLNDLVDDAVAVAEYYIHTRLRANPRTFLLLGHSIGGGVAAEAIGRGGALRHCPLVVDRSFISMTAAAAGMTGLSAAVIQRAYGILGVGNLWTMRAWHRIEHDKKLLLYSRRDEIIRFEVASPGSLAVRRLGDAAPTSADARPPDGRFLLELEARSGLHSHHNADLWYFDNGPAALDRIRKLWDP